MDVLKVGGKGWVFFSWFNCYADHMLRRQKMRKRGSGEWCWERPGWYCTSTSSLINSFCIAKLKYEIGEGQRAKESSKSWGDKMDSWENSINRRVSTSPARRTRFKQNVLPLLYPLVHRILGSGESRESSCNSSLLPAEVVFVVSKENEVSLLETHLSDPVLIIVPGKAAELSPFIGQWFVLDCSQSNGCRMMIWP